MQTTKLALAAILTSAPLLAVPFTAAHAANPTPILICTGKQQVISTKSATKIFITTESQSSDPSIARLGFQNYAKEAIIGGVAPGKAKVTLTVGETSRGVLRDEIPYQQWLYDVTVKNCVKIDAQIEPKPQPQLPDPSKTPVPLKPAYQDNFRTGQ